MAREARGRGSSALVDECIRRARLAGATALGLHSSKSMSGGAAVSAHGASRRAPELDFQPPGAEVVWGYRLVL